MGTIHGLNIYRTLEKSPDAAEIVRITGIVGPEFTREILKNALMYLTFFEAGCSNNEDIKKQIGGQYLDGPTPKHLTICARKKQI